MSLYKTHLGNEGFQVRSYQLEMLERSLKGNVIIAIDTGGGKTEIAALRIQAELNRCANHKRVWFLAPTVALCQQQHGYFQSRLPDSSPLLLTGSSNLEYWSEKYIWDAALHNHRLIVSTHAVLCDALCHGFVQLASLALLVFDEAHHCNRKHAANLIMQQFYFSVLRDGGPSSVPHILGLTASPVQRSRIEEIHQIEKNLNSVCVTPKKYRQELLTYVHRPKFSLDLFSQDLPTVQPGSALYTLRNLHRQVAIDMNDLDRIIHPDVLVISPKSFDPREKERLVRTINQYRRKSDHVYSELGSWASEYFIQKTNKLCIGSSKTFRNLNYRHDEKLEKVISKYFQQPGQSHPIYQNFIASSSTLSDKVIRLVDLIAQQSHKTTGVIFVKERVIVSVLYQILSTHPQTAKKFKFATFVGLSNNEQKKVGLHELLDVSSQNESLKAFRAREKHIIIATDVLEEGIDVAACNLVVCFDPPTNMRSFVQRRGRARKQQSLFVIMQPSGSTTTKIDRWKQLEEDIARVCQEEERANQAALDAENQDEHVDLTLQDELTGAILDIDKIKAHLHHFCNTLPRQPFVELSPCFSIEGQSLGNNPERLTAKVTLPNCVGSLKRSYSASGEYRTERAAFKAAAFECYKTLYEVGLVNGHFLPSKIAVEDCFQDLEPLIAVDESMQVRKQMAVAWSSSKLYKSTIHVEARSLGKVATPPIVLITPMPTPAMSFESLGHHCCFKLQPISTADTISSAVDLEDLRKHRRRMAGVPLPPALEYNDTAKLDFMYVFDFDNWHRLSSCQLPLDPGQVMVLVVDQVEKFQTAKLLQTTILSTCTFRDTAQIVPAITARSADSDFNFERHEFLGDAILKVVVSTQAFTDRTTWPAGWLSQYRDSAISNQSLANAALSLHLDQYILTGTPNRSKEALPRVSDIQSPPFKRQMRSKSLADVSQALFAAAYFDSGFNLARSCIKVFIPEIRSEPPTFDMPVGANINPYNAEEIQRLIGYQFRNITVLLQALTHASCTSQGSEESYQRLAFLGDAVLGFIVSKTLFQRKEKLSEGHMTEFKAAIVNSNMLGYICMAHSNPRMLFDISTLTLGPTQKVQRSEPMPLWKYMRQESRELEDARNSCIARYDDLCKTIQQQFQHGRTYPWTNLASLQPESFFSDLIQSVIGAIYVDSREDWRACQRFVDKIGISSIIERIVQHDYDVTHPKSLLLQLAPLADVEIQRTSDESFECRVRVEEVEIATAEGCRSEQEAVLLASHRANQLLLSRKARKDSVSPMRNSS